MLGIVIPVYNEADNIKKTLDAVKNNIKSPKEVMVVYDKPEDTTLPVLDEIINEYDFIITKQQNDYGKGALNAIKTGMRRCPYEAILVMMADLSDSLWVVDEMYDLISNYGYDLICGSRYMKGGKQHGGPILKGLFSKVAGKSLNILSGIPTKDATNSFKMYRKSMLDAIDLESSGGFEIGLEIAVKAYLKGYKITEVPAEWFDRTEGESNFKMWEWIPHYLHWYWMCISSKKK